MSTSASADEEELRAELRKKERDLLLAARYGKGLLEENERIKRDLENTRQEHANAMEVSGMDILCNAWEIPASNPGRVTFGGGGAFVK